MMRGTPGMRLTLAILSPIFLLLCVVAIHSEENRPWMRYQEQFKQLYLARATAKLKEATAANDATAKAHWQRVINEVSASQPKIAQVYLENLKVADRCTTCHEGIANPLFKDAPQPFRTHPGDVLKHHDINRFGCTPCHQGQGMATTVAGAHGKEANWLTPLLPAAYVEASCARCHAVTQGLLGAERVSLGANLFMEKGCYGCHDVRGISYVPKFGPPLTPIKAKLVDPRDWVYTWIKNPAHVSPDTAMPNFKLSDDEVGKITVFLMSLPAPKPYPHVALDGASAQDGERLFTERGCHGCHAVKPGDHSISPRVPNLAGIGSKVTADWLDQWIANPKAYNPDTAMPKLVLTDAERHSIVAYLLTLKRTEPIPSAPNLGRFKPEEGRELVKRYECFGCHEITGFDKMRPAVPNLADFARRPVDELDFGRTTDVPHTKWDWLRRKLRDPHAYDTDKIKLLMPVVPMTDAEAQALITYVLSLDAPTLPARYMVSASPAQVALRNMTWMVAHLNCNGCHRLNGRAPRIAQFLARKSLTPPTLEDVGARLQGEYMYQFLLDPKPVRPFMKIRMPNFSFTDAQAQTLVAGFAAAAHVTNPYTYVVKSDVDKEHFERGIRRFMHYKCVQCHPSSVDQGLPPGVDPDDLSINLMLAKKRLRPAWIKDFLARPKQIAGEQTRMPTVFYTVDGQAKVDHPQEDIDDIVAYLMGMTESPEVTLKAYEAKEKAEEQKKPVDWSTYKY